MKQKKNNSFSDKETLNRESNRKQNIETNNEQDNYSTKREEKEKEH